MGAVKLNLIWNMMELPRGAVEGVTVTLFRIGDSAEAIVDPPPPVLTSLTEHDRANRIATSIMSVRRASELIFIKCERIPRYL